VRRRHVGLPEYPALDEAHDVERGADDVFVLAQQNWLGDREALRVKAADRAELAVDRMRRRQQLAGWLAAQDVTACRRLEEVGRVRLAALELPHRERPAEALHLLGQIGFERRR